MTQYSPKAVGRLRAARVAGAAAVGVLGQFAVDMPDGYFGAADDVTTFGASYVALMLLGTLIAAAALVKRRAYGSVLSLILLSANIALFIPPMATGPLLAGAVAGWQLIVLATLLIPTRRGDVRDPSLGRAWQQDALAPWVRHYWAAARHLSLLSLVTTVVVVGYEQSHHVLAQVICVLLNFLTIAAATGLFRLLFRHSRRQLAILLAPLVVALFTVFNPEAFLALLAVFQLILLAIFFVRSPLVAEVFAHFFVSPALVVVASFVSLIGLTTLFLSFPAASATGQPLPFLTALFTAVSAVCVTGLSVVDASVVFSPFGLAVVVSAIQLGGLGIMVLSAFAMVMLGSTLGLRQEKAMETILEAKGARSTRHLVGFIVACTLAIEAFGALALTLANLRQGEPWARAAWHGLFHSVSAFCNAGFSLHSDSLMGFREDPVTLLIIAALVITGGLGFNVLAAVWQRTRYRRRTPWSVHVKLVLTVTFSLLLIGTVAYLGVEWNQTLRGLSVLDKVVNAFFMSTAARSSGFNSVDMTGLHPATISMLIVLMFIGAAPGSTGGGIKVTTAGILLATVLTLAKGASQITLFGRTIARGIVLRSAAIGILTLATITSLLFLLLLTQTQAYEALVFEITSAIGTVGWSLGVTPGLDSSGQTLIIIAMFIGRIGPLTAALAFLTRKKSRLVLPEETVMVG